MDMSRFVARFGERCWTNIVIAQVLVSSVWLFAQIRQPDLSALNSEDRASMESACSHAKYNLGPAAYYQCLQRQLDALSGFEKVDLSILTSEDRASIESACSHAKYNLGPATYHQCQKRQLEAMSGSQRIDLSGLTSEDRASLESACSHAKYNLGPAAFHQCLQRQLGALSGSQKIDLSGLDSGARASIESACSHAKYNLGPAAYHQCVGKQFNELVRVTDPGPLVDSQKPTAPPPPPAQSTLAAHERSGSNPEIQKLGYFLGNWTLSGYMKTSPLGPAGKFTGKQRTAWTPDGLFLASHWEEQRPGTGSDSGNAVYGYDSNAKVYTYRTVNSEGETEESKGTTDGDTWTWMSNLTVADGTARTGRYIIKEVSPTSYSFRFEIAPQNGEWTTVMDGQAVK
jgi:hypothetical protein